MLPDLRAKFHWQPDYGGFVRILIIFLKTGFTSTGFPPFLSSALTQVCTFLHSYENFLACEGCDLRTELNAL